MEIAEIPAPHTFEKKSYGRPIFCNYCSKFIWGIGGSGFECSVCRYAIHESCLASADLDRADLDTCDPTTLPSLFYSTLQTPPSDQNNHYFNSHHFLEANLTIGSICSLCESQVSSFGPHGLRCSKCHLKSHSSCFDKQPTLASLSCQPLYSKLLWNPTKSDCTPLIIFINSKSGGQQGLQLISKFLKYINPNQIFDLNKQPPEHGLKLFSSVPSMLILACGGDGTVSWVLDSIDKVYSANSKPRPPVAILPLGTGNDLSRTLGWGGGYQHEKIGDILNDIENGSDIQLLDRWKISLINTQDSTTKIMNNYFSVGIDAQIAYKFHELRESFPSLCFSRFANKLFYAHYGLQTYIDEIVKFNNTYILTDVVELYVDSKYIDLASLGSIKSVVILNLNSFMGGCDLWGEEEEDEDENGRWKSASIEDGLLEVVGLYSSLHMASIQANLDTAKRIAQGSTVEIRLKETSFVQIDGEPRKQDECVIKIERKDQVEMMQKRENVVLEPKFWDDEEDEVGVDDLTTSVAENSPATFLFDDVIPSSYDALIRTYTDSFSDFFSPKNKKD